MTFRKKYRDRFGNVILMIHDAYLFNMIKLLHTDTIMKYYYKYSLTINNIKQ